MPLDHGSIIVSLFIASWIVSTIIYRVKKYDDIEVNVTAPKPSTEISGSSGQ